MPLVNQLCSFGLMNPWLACPSSVQRRKNRRGYPLRPLGIVARARITFDDASDLAGNSVAFKSAKEVGHHSSVPYGCRLPLVAVVDFLCGRHSDIPCRIRHGLPPRGHRGIASVVNRLEVGRERRPCASGYSGRSRVFSKSQPHKGFHPRPRRDTAVFWNQYNFFWNHYILCRHTVVPTISSGREGYL